MNDSTLTSRSRSNSTSDDDACTSDQLILKAVDVDEGIQNLYPQHSAANRHPDYCYFGNHASPTPRSEIFENQYGGQTIRTFAPVNTNIGLPESEQRKRRRMQTSSQRTAANTRERRRMSHLNHAFKKLKDHLPNIRDSNRISRIQTLRAAISYIQYLVIENEAAIQR
ncbi:pancreas transcription factor 1 subunit alpha-like [Haliotis cracherodii]|uniref:pancreas transcription factor 1 subunit alpha-like n=1 Tax=Haliotis cracherodii TaxID=6455 RepID=UPI0039EAF8F5